MKHLIAITLILPFWVGYYTAKHQPVQSVPVQGHVDEPKRMSSTVKVEWDTLEYRKDVRL